MKPTISVTRVQVRELDRRAIEEYGIPGVVLMENAGRAVAEEAIKMLPTKDKKRVGILCGKGNNGGDGFVATRHLNNRGVEVQVYILCKVEEVASSPDAYTHLKVIQKMRIPIKEVITEANAKEVLSQLKIPPYPPLAKGGRALAGRGFKGFDLLVDALLGTGLTGKVREPYKTLIQGINSAGIPILSVDIPSGLDCDEGLPLGTAVKATKTVTFILPKKGFFKNQGPSYVGELAIADIGIPNSLLLNYTKKNQV